MLLRLLARLARTLRERTGATEVSR